ncbi:MAG: hypothetical protein JWO78_1489 [Micavibrio sp.]|nr:hypothetical protein [Micavibrio sp.]
MNEALRSALRNILHLTLWAMAIVFVLGIFCQIGVTAGVIWLGSPCGKAWVRREIATALAGTDYTLSYQDLYYTADRGILVNRLAIADAGGPLLQADYAAIRIALLPLLERRLSLTFEAGTVNLDHLPAGDPQAPQTQAPASIVIPDIYFHSIAVDELHIEHLQLGEKILGQKMMLEPRLKARALLDKSIDAELSMTLGQIDGTDISWLPQSLNVQAVLDPATTQITIESLKLSAPAYNMEGKGLYALAPGQPVDLQLSAAISHLDKLAQGLPGSLLLKGEITGTSDAPAFIGEGEADIDILKQRGLGPVIFNAKIPTLGNNIQGLLSLTTAYKEKTVSLSANLRYAETQLSIENLKGTAPDLAVSGAAILDTATMFVAGQISTSFDDLATYSDLAGLKLEGKGTVTADFDHPQDRQALKISARLDRIRYDTMTLAHADGKATIQDIKNLWPNAVDLTARGFNANDAKISTLSATLRKKEQGLDYHLGLNATGHYRQAFQLSGGADIGDLEQDQPDLKNIALNLKSAGNTLTLKGNVNHETINVTADTVRFGLRGLPLDIPALVQNFTLSGKAAISGPLSDPVVSSDLHLNTVSGNKAVPSVDLDIIAGYKGDHATASVAGKGRGIKTLNANLTLPLALSLKPFKFDLPQKTELDGDITLRGDGSALLGPFLPEGAAIGGTLDTKAKIAGTLSAPTVDGNFLFSGGSLREEGSGINLANIDLNALFSQSSVTIKTLTAQDAAGGTIKGSGGIGFGKVTTGQLNFMFSKLHALRTDKVDAVVSGTLALQGHNGGYRLSGQIDPDQTAITIPERLQGNIPELNIVKPGDKKTLGLTENITLDIRINANNRVFVRGWGLDAEFAGDLAVNGTAAAPLIDGTLSSIRGRYDEFGRHFTLEKADLRFQGLVPPSPYIDIKANLAASDVVASVLIAGPVTSPVVSFASTPSLPQDEVLSRILFGKNINRISPFQAIQLEQSLRRFSGKGSSGFDPLGKLRTATGLDDISVDSDASGATTVGAGKYVTDKVYIGVQRGQSETSGAANIRVDVTPNIAVESRVGQDAQGGAGVTWHLDY